MPVIRMRSHLPRRPKLAFIAWSSTPGRSGEIAAALGGESRCFYDLRIVDKRVVPLRYLLSALRTVAYLAIHRPRALIVTTPPVFPALIGYAYACLMRVPFVLDSHPLTFGFSTSRALQVMRPLQEWLVGRADAAMVTDALVENVRSLGGTPIIVHEAPPAWAPRPTSDDRTRPSILYVTIFATDEPVLEVLEAARQVPEVDVLMTGDLRKAPPSIAQRAAPNVRFLGFLSADRYVDALRGADVVMALTNRAEAVSRVASEAVWAERPLIVVDWPINHELFPHAVHVAYSADGIADGMRTAVANLAGLRAGTAAARQRQLGRWQDQLAALRRVLEPSRGGDQQLRSVTTPPEPVAVRER